MSTYAENRIICDPDESYAAVEFISIALSTSVLIFAVSLTVYSFKAVNKSDKLHNLLRWMIITTIIELLLYCISAISIPILCHTINESISMIGMTSAMLFYFMMMCDLLATLIIRLWLTFRGSMYQISTAKHCILMILLPITILVFFMGVGLYLSCIIISNDIQLRIAWVIYLALIAWSFYIITAIFAVSLFAQNMLKLTKLRTSTMKDVLEITRQNTEINKSQCRLIRDTSRYVSLFTLALLSSFVKMFIPIISNTFPYIFGGKFIYLTLISGSIDGVINISCLILQYSFCDRVYHKHCKWVECCWKRIFERNIHKSIEKKYEIEIKSRRKFPNETALHIPMESDTATNTDNKDTDSITVVSPPSVNYTSGNQTVTYSLSPNAKQTLDEILDDVMES